VLGALFLLGLGFSGLVCDGIVSGDRNLVPGAAVGTGLAAGGAIVAGAGLAAWPPDSAGGALVGGARWCGSDSRRAASATGRRIGGVASAGGSARSSARWRRMAAASVAVRPTADAPPPGRGRMKRAQTVSQVCPRPLCRPQRVQCGGGSP